ncbi:GNAT family N-acetyltransferase [Erwinia psidii]|uniref:lysophospholipid acyltransferase family protein n=1 Tax=Erwinia psidii TaxID=69224 RepID=UPI00226B7AD3|nr:lysophospholipid acyltransferase family protein [Erwinia psidii]MCX8959131.1 GNAT family N-acetyltransferase [Erwinia psidii]
MDNSGKIIEEFFPGKSFSDRARRLIAWAIGEKKLLSLLMPCSGVLGVSWIESVFEALQIRCETHYGDFDNVPVKGPAIVISNHPSVMDGLALINTVARVRKDIKIVANHVLKVMFPEAGEIIIGIKNMQGKMGHRQLKEMNDHLMKGGVLIICPAGRLASFTFFGLKESRWQEGFVRLAEKHQAVLVPVHIRGKNSFWYYLTAFIWRPLSNLTVFREIVRHKGRKMCLKIGPQVFLDQLENLDKNDKKKDYAGTTAILREHLFRVGRNQPALLPCYPPLTRPVPREELLMAFSQSEVLERLSDGKVVLLFQYQGEGWSPVIHELGRLREISYRAIGAGTGRRCDTDPFDRYYHHIVLWDPAALEILGAYRLTPAAEQLAKRGVDGLYSYSLFRYQHEFIPQLEKSIEVGRGFIQQHYQKSNALDALWKGIFSFIQRYPQAENLLGVLSIPGRFSRESKQLIIAFYSTWFSGEVEQAYRYDRKCLSEDNQMSGLFDGNDYEKDWILLNKKLRDSGYELPWPYKQAAKWYKPGGSKLLSFIEDENFNSVAGLNLCKIEKLKRMYKTHYLIKKNRNDNQ